MAKFEHPRRASTYRAARRNRCKAEHGVWPGIRPTVRYRPEPSGKSYPYNSDKRNQRHAEQSR